jgi:hypothetical protein
MVTKKPCALLGLLVVAVALPAAFVAGGRQPPAATAPPEPPPPPGWVDDPDAVRDCAAAMDCGRFRDTPAFADPDDGPEDVFLWEACRAVTGDVLPARDQKSVGSCVAFATATAVEHRLCVQIAGGSGEEYRDLAQEVIYGGSRVEVGGGRIRGDGSVGAWAA